MKELKKKIWRKTVMAHLAGGIIMVAIAIFILVLPSDEKSFFTASTDVFSLTAEELDTDAYYTCDNNLLLDYYASDDDGNYCITIVDRADGTISYMGFYVYSSSHPESELEQIMDETLEYFDGGTAPTTYLSGRGYVYEMNAVEKKYFKDWFEESGASQEIIDNLCYMTFVLVPEGKVWSFKFILGIGCFVIFLVGGIYLIFRFLTGAYLKNMKNTMKKFGVSEEALAYDLQMGKELKKAIVGRKCLVLFGFTPRLILCEQLVWCYGQIRKTKHRLYGIIPIGTTTAHFVNLITRENIEESLEVKNEEEGHEILKTISEVAPYVLMGYDERLAKLRASNFVQMIQLVEQRKNGKFDREGKQNAEKE